MEHLSWERYSTIINKLSFKNLIYLFQVIILVLKALYLESRYKEALIGMDMPTKSTT